MAEGHHLASGDDSGQHRLAGTAQKDHHHVVGRLLQCLQKRVGGARAQLVHTIQNVDLLVGLNGRERRVGHDLAHLFHQIPVRAGRGEIAHVGVLAPQNAPAAVAGAAGTAPRPARPLRAQKRLGERIGGLGLVGAGRPHEQVGLGHPLRDHRGAQKLAHLGLSQNVLEGVSHGRPPSPSLPSRRAWPPFPV